MNVPFAKSLGGGGGGWMSTPASLEMTNFPKYPPLSAWCLTITIIKITQSKKYSYAPGRRDVGVGTETKIFINNYLNVLSSKRIE